MKENKNKIRNFTSTPRMEDMIEELQERCGYNSFSALMQNAILDMHKKHFPAYKANSTSTAYPGMTPEKTGEMKYKIAESKKEAELKAKMERKANICTNHLFGQVEKDNHGNQYCVYTNYYPKKEQDAEQRVPLEGIGIELADNLFIPTKRAVLKMRPDLQERFKDSE